MRAKRFVNTEASNIIS